MEDHQLGPKEDDPGYWDGIEEPGECPHCGNEDECRCVEILVRGIKELGWKQCFPANAYEIPGNDDLLVEIDPGYGYAWQIRQFTDGDIDGVAVGRYEPIPGAEGDTIRELLKCIEDIRMKASERASDERERVAAARATDGGWNDRTEED